MTPKSRKRNNFRRYSRRHLRRTNSRPLRNFCYVLLTATLIATGYVGIRIQVIKAAKNVATLKSRLIELEKEYKYSNIKVAQLAGVEKIERRALQMGLGYTSLSQLVLIETGDSKYTEPNLWDESLVYFKKLKQKLFYSSETKTLAQDLKNEF